MKVLIVEDENIVGIHLQAVVRRLNYEVGGMVATGEEAVQAALSIKPDIILMDVMLRGNLSGLEAAEQIRLKAQIPVIYVTANSDDKMLDQVKQTQPYGYLTKPIRDKELHAAIEMALYKSQSDRTVSHLNEVLRVIRDISHLTSRERDPLKLLNEAASLLVRTRGYIHAWIALAEPPHHVLRPVASVGSVSVPVPGLTDSGPGATETLPARAQRTGLPVVCRNIDSDPLSASWRETAMQKGIAASVAIPLKRPGRIMGVLLVCSDRAETFNSEELDVLEELCRDLTLALQSIEDESARHRGEQALRQSEEKFRSIFEHMAEGVALHELMWSENGRAVDYVIIGVNASYESITNQARGEVVGRRATEIYGIQEAPFLEEYVKVVKSGNPTRMEAHFAPLNRFFEFSVTPWGGNGFATIFTDITQRKHAEDAIQQSESRYRRLLREATLPILIFSMGDNRIIYANRLAASLLEITEESALGRNAAEFFASPEDQQRLIDDVKLKGHADNLEISLQTGSQKHIWSLVSASRIEYDGSQAVCLSLNDITARVEAERAMHLAHEELERRVRERTAKLVEANLRLTAEMDERQRAEQALRQSELSYRLLAENSSDVISRHSLDNRILYVSPAVKDLIGYPTNELLGVEAHMLVHPDDLATWRTNQPRTQSITGGRLLEMRLRHKDGRYIWVEINSKLILDPESREPIEIVRATRDITERKRAEEQIRQALLKEREISEMKSRFISSASHEFRTPMTAAAGSAELLRTHFSKLTEQKRNELLGRIESAVQRVIAMLDDVLAVSRMESGKTKFKPVPVNLAAILHDLVSEAQLADKDAHKIHLEVPSGNSEATADNALLRTIIGNLISNALRYSPKGTEVHVWLVMQENSALIAVKDQGIGIPESDRARIFQAFERGSNVGQIKGTGLGLNIVRRMVELHGGTLDFTSQVGLGTTFTVWIPIVHQ